LPLSGFTRLISWALRYKAVAAICMAGIVAAVFLMVSIASHLGSDHFLNRATSDSGPDRSDTVYRDVSPEGVAASGAARSTTGRAGAAGTDGDGQAAAPGHSMSTPTAGEVDAYIASDAAWREGAFAASFERGGKPWDGDSASSDNQVKATQGDDEASPDDDQPEEPYPRNAMIAGRVISDSGMALVGIGVTATGIHFFDVPPGLTVPVGDLQRRAVSDTAGYYRFDNLAAGEYRINNVPTETYGMTQIAVRSGVDFADLVLKNQRPLTVSGVVTDTTGQPLAGAQVQPQSLGARGAYTDSAGRFQLQLQIQEQAQGLGIRTALYGYREKMTLVNANQVSAEQSVPVTIQLEPLEKHAVVTGILRSSTDGTPVTGKTVQLYSAENRQRYHATSSVDGRFQMIAVEADVQYELLVAGGGGYATYLQPNVSVGENGLDLELLLDADESRTLKGRMVNLNGTPIPHFSLVARAANPPYQAMRVTSDAAGNFILRNPPQSPLVFESQSMPHLYISGVQIPPISEQTVSLMLDIGRDEIYGFVVDASGAPVAVPNVVVSWRYTQNGITSSSTRRVAADSQGGLAAGSRYTHDYCRRGRIQAGETRT
jgi:hypothetical protein